MKKHFIVILTFMLIIGVVIQPALAKTGRVIKLSHSEKANDLFEDHYLAFTTVFKNIIERDTQGRFNVSIFPNGQLGDNRSALEQTRKGLIDVDVTVSVGLLGAYDPRFALFEMPYAFKSSEHISKMFETSFTKSLIEGLAKSKGIRVVEVLPAGMRCFSNNVRPIVSPKDMKGLKMRSMEIPIYMKMTEALGASPVPIPWSELYTACQTGIVDGQENAPQSIMLIGVHEVQKYLTLDNHTGNTMTIVANEKFYQSLSKEDQIVFDRAIRQAAQAFMGVLITKEARDLNYLATKMKITSLTPAQQNEFRKLAMPPCIKYMEGEVGKKVVDEFLTSVEKSGKGL